MTKTHPRIHGCKFFPTQFNWYHHGCMKKIDKVKVMKCKKMQNHKKRNNGFVLFLLSLIHCNYGCRVDMTEPKTTRAKVLLNLKLLLTCSLTSALLQNSRGDSWALPKLMKELSLMAVTLWASVILNLPLFQDLLVSDQQVGLHSNWYAIKSIVVIYVVSGSQLLVQPVQQGQRSHMNL